MGMSEKKGKLIALNAALFRDKKVLVVIIIGIIGMLLIVFADGIFKGSSGKSDGISFDEREYIERLEKKLTEMLSDIDGVGKCKVMITLEAGAEYIYATEVSVAASKTTDSATRESQQNNTQDNYILVSDGKGGQQPVLLKRLEPMIRGVAVLCSGGDKVVVKQKVIDAVTTVLNINSSRVCVIKKID